jgi:hypothetical protein
MDVPAQVAQAQAQAAPPPVPFALTPARVSNTVLDYNNPISIKLYKGAVKTTGPWFQKDLTLTKNFGSRGKIAGASASHFLVI